MRAHITAGTQSIAVCPGTSEADALESALKNCASAAGLKLDILTLPETERGKLRFPGAESRRAQALDQILSGRFDILIGSVTAFTGAAPVPVHGIARFRRSAGMITLTATTIICRGFICI